MESFIWAVKRASIQTFPHSVYLMINCMSAQSCGASLLNQGILLTAAHCLFHCAKTSWVVEAYAGHYDIEKMTMLRKAITLVIHDDFNPSTFDNDVGLIKVDRSFILGPTVKRVSIHHTKLKAKEAMVAGWGITNQNWYETSDFLTFTGQKIIPNAKYPRELAKNPGIFCSRGINHQDSPGSGDSGCAYVSKYYQQIGLVSFADERYPDLVFNTDVSYHFGWIKRIAKRMFCHQMG